MCCGRVSMKRSCGGLMHLIFEKLPKRTKTVLAMPEKERAKVIRERKKMLKEACIRESNEGEKEIGRLRVGSQVSESRHGHA